MVEVIYGSVLGLLAGLAFHRITVYQIKRRTEDTAKYEAVDNIAVIVTWMLLSAALFGIVFWLKKDTAVRIEYVLYMSIAVSIAVVDIDIKKIPNMSLLAFLIIRTGFIIYGMFTGGTFKTTVLPALIGLAVGFVLYSIPSFLHIPIGAGDVKYCAVIGYCLGILGFLQASLVMALGLVIYLIYLVGTKKGSLKTATAMGPYLSLGVVATLIYPVFDSANWLS